MMMSAYRLKEIVVPLLIAMFTTLLTVGSLSLLLQTPEREVSATKTIYMQSSTP
ncbi:hypothetical protein [Leptolyngbya sp. FACHB-711]|uniref:hypothetical protein n=1 Tax=unclassified Leptolyngbya TaxID=2650499 RepID=UPI00168649F9|nr:hypothetical protein [Leptolyngbya sp. FACHB-711]MBD1851053.1 hypothetical protein [Cyanobacteria bacterium FACHB-502]MBD2026886.1 hypothetical protein [Leptolyngbya sp. FACHB-711]